MRVLFPYLAGSVEERAVNALFTAAPGFEPHELDGDTDYFDLLEDAWLRGEEFAIVEHDIEVVYDSLTTMKGCGGLWCGHPYRYLGGMYLGLGCCRFNPELMARVPDLFSIIGEQEDVTHPKRFWCSIDARMHYELTPRGIYKCAHQTAVTHIGVPWPSHGCGGPPPDFAIATAG